MNPLSASVTEPAAPSPAPTVAGKAAPLWWLVSPFTHTLAVALFGARFAQWMAWRLLSQPAWGYLFVAGLVYLFHGNYWLTPLYLFESFLLVQVSTLLFDGIHFALHRFADSRVGLLRWLGGLHLVHHRFLDEELRIHDPLRRGNTTHHVLPEFLTHLVCAVAALPLLGPIPVVRTIAIEVVVLALYLKNGGNDANHQAHEVVRAGRPSLFVDTWYHSLHHVYPDSYFSSINTVFDRVFGGGCRIRGRRVALVGAADRFTDELMIALERAGAVGLQRLADPGDAQLREIDILVVGEAPAAARVALIERFRAATAERRFPVEVWAVGPERFAAGDFSAHARRYYADERFYYRHIVRGDHARAGAARYACFLLRRGFRYVPASASGVGLLGFFKFRFLQRPAS